VRRPDRSSRGAIACGSVISKTLQFLDLGPIGMSGHKQHISHFAEMLTITGSRQPQ